MARQALQGFVVVTSALFIACGIATGQESNRFDAKSELVAAHAAIEQLRAEVTQLRQEIVQLQAERRRDVIQQMKTELMSVRAELARLAELDRAREQDVRDLEELLTAKDVAAGERPELEATRGELAVTRAREIDQQSEVAKARESELLRRLQTEEQLVQRLAEPRQVTGGRTQ